MYLHWMEWRFFFLTMTMTWKCVITDKEDTGLLSVTETPTHAPNFQSLSDVLLSCMHERYFEVNINKTLIIVPNILTLKKLTAVTKSM